jgi:hypothetical protein
VLNLNDPSVSYFIMSSKQIDATKTLLWAKEWEVLPLKGYYNNTLEDSILAYKECSNEELKDEAIFMLKTFKEESCIVKYKGNKNSNKLYNNRKESELTEAFFNTESANKSYLYNGMFFSYNEVKSYKIIETKEELKNGIIVEFFDNKNWKQKIVNDKDLEWEHFYKLMVKYKKVRIAI